MSPALVITFQPTVTPKLCQVKFLPRKRIRTTLEAGLALEGDKRAADRLRGNS